MLRKGQSYQIGQSGTGWPVKDDSMSEDKVIEHFKTLNRGTMDQFDQICKNLIFCGISNSGKYLSDKIKPKEGGFEVYLVNTHYCHYCQTLL